MPQIYKKHRTSAPTSVSGIHPAPPYSFGRSAVSRKIPTPSEGVMDNPPRYRYQKATFAVHLPYYSFGRSLHFPCILHSFRRSMGRTPSLQTPESYFRRKSSPYSFRRGKPDIIQQAEDRILPLEPRAASLFSLPDFHAPYNIRKVCRKTFGKQNRPDGARELSSGRCGSSGH